MSGLTALGARLAGVTAGMAMLLAVACLCGCVASSPRPTLADEIADAFGSVENALRQRWITYPLPTSDQHGRNGEAKRRELTMPQKKELMEVIGDCYCPEGHTRGLCDPNLYGIIIGLHPQTTFGIYVIDEGILADYLSPTPSGTAEVYYTIRRIVSEAPEIDTASP